jgi:putative Ig domain-containing protein
VISAAMTGCGEDTATLPVANQPPPGSVSPPVSPPTNPAPAPANQAPTINGSASASAVVGQPYNFTPSASDPEQDVVSFTIANKPAWAAFNTKTGALTGTPAAADVGTFANIEIAATDGNSVTPLPQFTLTVSAAPNSAGSPVELAWTPPTENVDGSALTDLSGYKIHYGDSPQTYSETIAVTNPGLTRFALESLPAGTHYVAMTAYNSVGAESDYSDEVKITVN